MQNRRTFLGYAATAMAAAPAGSALAGRAGKRIGDPVGIGGQA